MLKIYGYYQLPWQGSIGAYAVAQSGQPWEAWNVLVYRNLTTSSIDTNRYAERAGIRRSPTHHQLDVNYTQNIRLDRLGPRLNVQLVVDVFNIYDNQTPYNYNPFQRTPQFNTPRSYFDPRRAQVAVRVKF